MFEFATRKVAGGEDCNGRSFLLQFVRHNFLNSEFGNLHNISYNLTWAASQYTRFALSILHITPAQPCATISSLSILLILLHHPPHFTAELYNPKPRPHSSENLRSRCSPNSLSLVTPQISASSRVPFFVAHLVRTFHHARGKSVSACVCWWRGGGGNDKGGQRECVRGRGGRGEGKEEEEGGGGDGGGEREHEEEGVGRGQPFTPTNAISIRELPLFSRRTHIPSAPNRSSISAPHRENRLQHLFHSTNLHPTHQAMLGAPPAASDSLFMVSHAASYILVCVVNMRSSPPHSPNNCLHRNNMPATLHTLPGSKSATAEQRLRPPPPCAIPASKHHVSVNGPPNARQTLQRQRSHLLVQLTCGNPSIICKHWMFRKKKEKISLRNARNRLLSPHTNFHDTHLCGRDPDT